MQEPDTEVRKYENLKYENMKKYSRPSTKPLVHYTVLVSEVTISKLQNTLLLFKIVRVSIDSAIINAVII